MLVCGGLRGSQEAGTVLNAPQTAPEPLVPSHMLLRGRARVSLLPVSGCPHASGRGVARAFVRACVRSPPIHAPSMALLPALGIWT